MKSKNKCRPPVNSPIFLSIRKNVLYSNTISNVAIFQKKTVCRGIGEKSSGCKQKVRKPEFLVSINAAQKLTLDSSCEYRFLTNLTFFCPIRRFRILLSVDSETEKFRAIAEFA